MQLNSTKIIESSNLLIKENNNIRNHFNRLIENSKSLDELSKLTNKDFQENPSSQYLVIIIVIVIVSSGINLVNIILKIKKYFKKYVRRIEAPIAMEKRKVKQG